MPPECLLPRASKVLWGVDSRSKTSPLKQLSLLHGFHLVEMHPEIPQYPDTLGLLRKGTFLDTGSVLAVDEEGGWLLLRQYLLHSIGEFQPFFERLHRAFEYLR